MKWRTALAPLALIALAASASYGVYRFQAHFTPAWVALISATSFELTYVGLAVLQTSATRRATAISVGAVVVSVVYNSLSALFDIRPALFTDAPLSFHVVLAVLHGVPLAVVAFLVADLLLHSNAAPVSVTPALPVDAPLVIVADSAPLSKTAIVKQIALQHGVSESTIWRKVKAGELALNGKEAP